MQKTIENGHRNSGFSHLKYMVIVSHLKYMVIVHSYVNVYQRVHYQTEVSEKMGRPEKIINFRLAFSMTK